jgi:hypothetical protein
MDAIYQLARNVLSAGELDIIGIIAVFESDDGVQNRDGHSP